MLRDLGYGAYFATVTFISFVYINTVLPEQFISTKEHYGTLHQNLPKIMKTEATHFRGLLFSQQELSPESADG